MVWPVTTYEYEGWATKESEETRRAMEVLKGKGYDKFYEYYGQHEKLTSEFWKILD